MKKRLAWTVAILCLLIFSVHCVAEDRLTMADLNSEDAFSFQLTRLLRLAPTTSLETSHYSVQQGCATDGVYGYFILENQKEHLDSIWKVDLSDGSIVDQRFGLALDHGNDMTYNAKTGQLIVVNNKPNYNKLSFIDPETLEITDTRRVPLNMYAIACCEALDQYVVGLSGGYDFAILDSEFKQIATFSGEDTGLVRQGADCDEQYIYFPQSSDGAQPNAVMVYDWSGNLVSRIGVKGVFQEVESMFHIGDALYLAFNAGGSYVYTADLVQE